MSLHFGSLRGAAPKRRPIVIYGTGILLSTVFFFAVILLTNTLSTASKYHRLEPQIAPQPGMVAVIVANTELRKGVRITAADLRKVPWPRDLLPEGAVTSIEEAENSFALTQISERLPIRRSNISRTAPLFGLGDALPDGYRAIAINVTATTSVESRASAGAHVDVFLTYADPKDGQFTTIVVAENIIVLSLGGEADSSTRDDSVRTATDMEVATATLAVPAGAALKIQTAVAMGRISLVLRSQVDVGSSPETIFRGDDFDGKRHQAPSKTVAANSCGGYAKVQGADGETQEFRLCGENWESSDFDPNR